MQKLKQYWDEDLEERLGGTSAASSAGGASAGGPESDLLPSQKASIMNASVKDGLKPSHKDDLIWYEPPRQVSASEKKEYERRLRSRAWHNLFVNWIRLVLVPKLF